LRGKITSAYGKPKTNTAHKTAGIAANVDSIQ
jgi:hypothetical protein